jgi:hypothetical protein
VHIAAQPVELGHADRGLRLARQRQRVAQHRTTVEGVGALAGLNLDVLADQLQALGLGEAGDGVAASRPRPDLPCRSVETRR